LRRERPNVGEPRRLLIDGLQWYIELGRRPHPDAPRAASAVMDELSRVMPQVSDADRATLTDSYAQLQKQIASPAQSPGSNR